MVTRVNIGGMLEPTNLAELADGALAQLRLALRGADGAPLERDAALAVLRRHLARMQLLMRDSFEQSRIQGVAGTAEDLAPRLREVDDAADVDVHVVAPLRVNPDASGRSLRVHVLVALQPAVAMKVDRRREATGA